jgi:hypothetical protein
VHGAVSVAYATWLTTSCIGCTEERQQEREGLCVHHLLVESKAQATARVDAAGTKTSEE